MFLPTSETFIYNQLKAFQQWRAVVLCRQQLNHSRFPANGLDVQEPSSLVSRLVRSRLGRTAFARGLLIDADGLAWLRRTRPDVLLAHFGPNGMGVKRIARMSRTPLVVVFHGYDATESLAGMSFEERYPGLADSSVLLLAVSDFIAQQLLRSGAPASKVEKHYIGIPIPEVPAPHAFSGRILQVGRLTEKKGHDTTLTGFALALRQNPDLQLRIVGSGPLRQELEQQASTLGIARNVNFLGDLPASHVQSELQAADIFLHPSKIAKNGDGEGLGMAILEAMAHNVPVLATTSGGIPEMVDDSCGILISEGDADALSEAISRLVGDQGLRGRLARAARARVEERFDIMANTAKLESILRGLLQHSGELPWESTGRDGRISA